jgi:hypothetical protein
LGRKLLRRVETDDPRAGGVTDDVDSVAVGHREFLAERSPDGRRRRLKLRSSEVERLLSDGNARHD